MQKIRTLNDVEAVYDKGHRKLPNGLYVCPMCEKCFKTESGAKNHVDKRDCHKLVDIIKGGVHETRAYGLYKMLLEATGADANKLTIQTFRKSPYYNTCARFMMFCATNEVFNSDIYISWLNEVKKLEQINLILTEGLKESNLREFRIFAQVTGIIPSDSYFKRNVDLLNSDDEFFVRSIERSRIGLLYLLELEGDYFETRMKTLSYGLSERVKAFADMILK